MSFLQMNECLEGDLEPSRNASQIPQEVTEEIICRFLVNLPDEEKEFPRCMMNIRQACFFYVDNYFGLNKPSIDNEFMKKFAREIFRRWPYL